MTIAFVSTIRSFWGGSEELWFECAKEALKNGHKVIISSYDCGTISDKTQRLVDEGAKLDLRAGSIKSEWRITKKIATTTARVFRKRLGNQFAGLFKFKPDVVVYVGTAYSIADDYQLLKLVIKNKAKFLINIQLNYEYNNQPLPPNQAGLILKAYRFAKKVAFVSQRNLDVASKILGQPIPNALVVRNPVNIKSIALIPFPKQRVIQMAVVGYLTVKHKGQDILLQILATDTWISRHWQLNLYGSGEDEIYLKKMVENFGLTGKVIFHGRVEDIRKVWDDNQVLLMPSHMEGMPLAAVEAMLCGRPCIITDVGGSTEWITDGKEGFIAETPTVHSFGQAMERAWHEKDNWEQIGKKAHERAMKQYDPEPGETLLNLITS